MPERVSPVSDEAFVTLATHDNYAMGAVVLGHSLRRVATTRQLAVMITCMVTDRLRRELYEVFDCVVEVNVLDSQDAVNLALLARPDLGITFSKLHCWRLTQYKKCVFLDADTLVLQNVDDLFGRDEFSAAPDAGWPDCFNSGVFVYAPSLQTYQSLLDFATEQGSFDGGDQGLLNMYFNSWSAEDINKRLPFTYNVVSQAFYSYLPAFTFYGKDVKICHFIGAMKPWSYTYNTATHRVEGGDSGNDAHFLQLWWELFMSRVQPKLMQEPAVSHDDHVRCVPQSEPIVYTEQQLNDSHRQFAWQRGQIDYMGIDSYQNIELHIKKMMTNPDYNKMILSSDNTEAKQIHERRGVPTNCWNCQKSLVGGHRYILREDHPFCIACYEAVHAFKCDECKQVIGIDSKDLSVKEKHWHDACFKCFSCERSLLNNPFSCKDDRMYCTDCYTEKFAGRCDACGGIFRAGMKFGGKLYHDHCFSCLVCNEPIGNKLFVPREDNYVCTPCYEAKFAEHCYKCNAAIVKGGITYHTRPVHRECFTCTQCSRNLVGEKFTSQQDDPYCTDCYGELFATKCTRCIKPIAGPGGTKMITVAERHWHADCFSCYDCNTSLVGVGCVADEEHITCADCRSL